MSSTWIAAEEQRIVTLLEEDDWGQDRIGERERVAAIDRLGEIGGVLGLSYFVNWFLRLAIDRPDAGSESSLLKAATRTVRRIVERLGIDDLAAIHPRGEYRRVLLEPRTARALQSFASEPAVLGLHTFHASGYVREEAVRLLAERRDGTEIPWLVLRTNDWVDAVANRARHAVMDRIESARLEDLAKLLPWMGSRSADLRRDLSSIVDAWNQRVCVTDREAFLQRVPRFPARSRREAFRRLAASGVDDRLLEAGLADADFLIRLRLILWAPPEIAERSLRAALADPVPAIRAAALDRLTDLRASAVVDLVRARLFDPSGSVRSVAIYWWKKLGGTPTANELYRAELTMAEASPERIVAALRGLLKLRDASDAAFGAAFLDHRSPVVRAAALALHASEPHPDIDAFIAALSDRSKRVRKQARIAIQRGKIAISRDRLAALVSSQPFIPDGLLYPLLDLVDITTALAIVLERVARQDAMSPRALQWFLRWRSRRNRTFTSPDPADVERSRSQFALAEARLPADLAREIRAALGLASLPKPPAFPSEAAPGVPIRAVDVVRIASDLESVWRVLVDFAAYPRWYPRQVALRVISSTEGGVGTDFRLRPFCGRAFFCRVEEIAPRSRIRMRYHGGFIAGTGEWRLSSEGVATKVEYECDVVAAGRLAAIAARFLFLPKVHSSAMRHVLHGLAREVERRRRSS